MAEVAVLPRSWISGLDRFTPWSRVRRHLIEAEAGLRWLPRREAELADDFVQPIPCAVIRNARGDICVLRRVRDTRADLQTRITLVVGGHVDRPDREQSFEALLVETLVRELEEELGLSTPKRIRPAGLVIDALSTEASRHVAVVFEVKTLMQPKTRALEEFSARSKFSGAFFSPKELARFHREFDPWSLLVFEDYLLPGYRPKRWRQTQLVIPPDQR